ncbi:MAG: alanine--tRNA ligase [Deltaproteobacteria bacterium RIFOXYD12_FULL_57_12]|nr:MAG: alanine--tRNA ligase [Deltaproteobacteria bacterium RIFOXYD12_FULL_57_12]
MTGNEIRALFLKYFAEQGHTIVDSSPLVPQDDPTLLFTNAGMVQFKQIFTGEEKQPFVRAATCQRCVRAGGKHNDLENVGHTARHHTFFEMLGNFSFGDYFKTEAIHFAWDFLTKVLGLPPTRLWVSVFKDDDEAYDLWEQIDDLPPGRLIRLGEKDNFWAMGDTGPCGPCSEIHIDQGPEVGCGRPDCRVGCDCDRFLELWNLVFMQFYRDTDGQLTPLPKPSIDTGMGLERISAVMQGKHTNYDADLFSGLIARIAALTGKSYGADNSHDTAMRVIADHSRAIAFLVADGVLPSNEGRGYVLRRIMRRAVRFGRALGLEQSFLAEVTALVVDQMQKAYPHLQSGAQLLAKVTRNEEERFRETLDNGLALLNSELARLNRAGEKRLDGEFIFKLYDTYGFPLDIVRDVAQEQGMTVDEAGFAEAMDVQRQRSKKSWKEGGQAAMAKGIRALMADGHKARFIGYESRRAVSTITGLVDEHGEAVSIASQGDQVSVFCPETPFYAEAGGQIGDRGEIIGPAGRGRVKETITVGDGLILHETEIITGTLACGEAVELAVAEGRRQRIACNHTATHLLQAALKAVLGDHVKQAGSLVTADRLRFDFTHFSPVNPVELKEIELRANREIRTDLQVATEVQDREAALQSGATALFGEKYETSVRVVSLGDFSRELCGGTHVARSGEIGLLKIVTETGIAAGIRRIEALTGEAALAHYQAAVGELETLAGLIKSPVDELRGKFVKILARQKDMEKEVSRLTAKLATGDLDGLLARAAMVGDIKVLAVDIPLDSPKTLREVGDRLRDRLTSGVVALGGVHQDKAALLVMVTKDLVGRLHAGDLIREMAGLVGGKGGGRPDMAQAGGPQADKLRAALDAVPAIIRAQLAG